MTRCQTSSISAPLTQDIYDNIICLADLPLLPSVAARLQTLRETPFRVTAAGPYRERRAMECRTSSTLLSQRVQRDRLGPNDSEENRSRRHASFCYVEAYLPDE